MLKILYITSASHSGSTLLDLLLSSHPAISGFGELKVLSERVKSQRVKKQRKAPLEGRCACKTRPVTACPFWTKVNEALDKNGLCLDSLDLYAADTDTFKRHNTHLFEALSHVTGSNLLVDSSKDLFRLRRLMEETEMQVLPLHLVRDPRGVVNSHMKRGRPLMPYALDYTQRVLRTRQYLAGKDHQELRYEDLVEDPPAALDKLLQPLDLTFDPVQLEWADKDHHQLAGNKLRRMRTGTICKDESWKSTLSILQQFRIRCTTFPTRLPGSNWYNSYQKIKGNRARQA